MNAAKTAVAALELAGEFVKSRHVPEHGPMCECLEAHDNINKGIAALQSLAAELASCERARESLQSEVWRLKRHGDPSQLAARADMRRQGLVKIISQTEVTERMGYPDVERWKELAQRVRQIARDSLAFPGDHVLFEGAIIIPKDSRKGKEPCGECHIQPGTTCDLCGAHREQTEVRGEG